MKIRTQLSLLILVLLFMPVICLITLPIYHYSTSSQRHLMKGYKQIRKLGELNLSDEDWDVLKKEIEQVPPHVQIAVFYKNCILISNIPDLKAGQIIDFFTLFDYLGSTSGEYDYQIQAPLFENRSSYSKGSDRRDNSKLIVISRSAVPDNTKRISWTNRLFIILFSFFFLFEAFCLTIIVKLFKTITLSITMLEENTKHIADGELDYELTRPKKDKFSNEITNLTENLDKMRLSLKDDQERRSKFIMGLSHDLRTPVALIKGYAEAIGDGVVEDSESIIKSANIIHTKADQLEGMINDLINYQKLNNAEWLQTLENVNITPLLMNFAEGCRLTADVYKRTITTSVNINPDLKIKMDEKLLLRALENLFSNALRYTKDNDNISFIATESLDNIEITVSDTGCGIQEKDLSHIYDIFYRGTNSRRESGMGIGLSVVKNIIDTHGWKINVETELEKGTKFIITIPKGAN